MRNIKVNVTELRSHLPKYLSSAQKGIEIIITSHGQAIARILPPIDIKSAALTQIKELRKSCKVFDVISPIDESWDVEK